jgi:hypothetical protein
MASRFQLVPGAASAHAQPGRWPAEWTDSIPAGLGWSFAHHSSDGQLLSTAWRLVGANNLELGRSARTYANVASCRQAIVDLVVHIDKAKSHLAINTDTGLWTWRLDIGDQWIAVAGRSYQRRRECLYNVTRFVAAAPTAEFAGDLLGRSGPREGSQATSQWSGLPSPRIDLTHRQTRVTIT